MHHCAQPDIQGLASFAFAVHIVYKRTKIYFRAPTYISTLCTRSIPYANVIRYTRVLRCTLHFCLMSLFSIFLKIFLQFLVCTYIDLSACVPFNSLVFTIRLTFIMLGANGKNYTIYRCACNFFGTRTCLVHLLRDETFSQKLEFRQLHESK